MFIVLFEAHEINLDRTWFMDIAPFLFEYICYVDFEFDFKFNFGFCGDISKSFVFKELCLICVFAIFKYGTL